MPVVLTPERARIWVDVRNHSFSECMSFLTPYQNGLEWYKVSSNVGSIKYKEPDCLLSLEEVQVCTARCLLKLLRLAASGLVP